MERQSSPTPIRQIIEDRSRETKRVVSDILDQIPELTRIRQVRRRDGSLEDFEPQRVGEALEVALKAVGASDEALLAKMTHQALTRLERDFDGREAPSSSDIDNLIALTLIDNNLAYAAKKHLAAATGFAPVRVRRAPGGGLRFRRRFSRPETHPYDELEWERRDAVIMNDKGQRVFDQRGVEVPKAWSQSATNIVASKYFRGTPGQDRENSVRQMIDRVVHTIVGWGIHGGYFATEADAETYEAELTAILATQRAAFNSPVWFNVGVVERPQCSACFINSVQDDMRSILNLAVTEGMLFKYGSGTGSNLSSLRSSKERLSCSGGKSSGPVSFMKGYDAFAGVIKSGGKTRRAAKMVILNVDHPDIEDFITCKSREERKARTLVAAGYDGTMDGEAYASVFFQNANNSVRVTDDFMRAVLEDGEWQTRAVTSGEPVETMRARGLMRHIAEAAWECGDPGVQFDTTANRWNTVPNSGRINGSNPCSEYMFIDDSSCNLASLNLLKFRRPDGEFDVESFKHAVEVVVTAQEIVVDSAGYPTPAIEANSSDFRPLGLGFANLGALLMSRGLAYDSDEGRNFAGAITALMSGHAYFQSAKLAQALGPFYYYKLNEKPMLRVIGAHRDRAYEIPEAGLPTDLLESARQSWDNAFETGLTHGFRNAQISCLAPTGTIGFLMDCDTTGVEPDIALVKYKWLVGGGLMKIVNQTVPESLTRLGYADASRTAILEYLDKSDTIEGAPGLKPEHLPVFDCAFRPAKGKRSIGYQGHIRMMAAVQPFVSGAISKTVNLPNEATPEDVERTFIESWKSGLKAIAIYRDGSKGLQVLTTSAKQEEKKRAPAGEVPTAAPAAAPALSEVPSLPAPSRVEGSRGRVPATTRGGSASGGEGPAAPLAAATESAPTPLPAASPSVAPRTEYKPQRRRLSEERKSITHKFSVAGYEGYVTVGLYDDGTPGELFLRMAKGGTVISGLMDSLAMAVSIALQYGVPLRVLVNKFIHIRFEPSGFTSNPKIRIAKSLVDYLFRWLALKFLSPEDQQSAGLNVDLQTLAETGRSDVESSKDPQMLAAQEAATARAENDHRQMKLADAAVAAVAPAAATSREATADALTLSFDAQSDAPVCDTCGALMIRNGACYKCLNCGSTSGCS